MGLQQAKLVTRHSLREWGPTRGTEFRLFQICNPSLASTLGHTKQKAIVSRHASTLTLALPLDRLILFTMSAKTTKRSILWRLFFASTSNILFLKKFSGGCFFQHLLPERVSSQADVVAAEWNPNTEQISDLKFISDSESRLVKTVKNYWMGWWHCILDCLALQLGGWAEKKCQVGGRLLLQQFTHAIPLHTNLKASLKKKKRQNFFDLKCSKCWLSMCKRTFYLPLQHFNPDPHTFLGTFQPKTLLQDP